MVCWSVAIRSKSSSRDSRCRYRSSASFNLNERKTFDVDRRSLLLRLEFGDSCFEQIVRFAELFDQFFFFAFVTFGQFDDFLFVVVTKFLFAKSEDEKKRNVEREKSSFSLHFALRLSVNALNFFVSRLDFVAKTFGLILQFVQIAHTLVDARLFDLQVTGQIFDAQIGLAFLEVEQMFFSSRCVGLLL